MTQNKHKGKRLLAGLLSFLMVATGLPFGEMDARASSLVPNTSLTDNGDRYPYMHTDGSATVLLHQQDLHSRRWERG